MLRNNYLKSVINNTDEPLGESREGMAACVVTMLIAKEGAPLLIILECTPFVFGATAM